MTLAPLAELAELLAYDRAAERLFVPAPTGGIDARDVDSGWLRWHSDLADRALVASNGRLLVRQGRTLRVLEVDTGAPRCEVGTLDAPSATAEGPYAWVGDLRIDLDTCALAAVPQPRPARALTTLPAGADGLAWSSGRWVGLRVEATGCTWYTDRPPAERGLGACDFAVYHDRDAALLGRGNERVYVRLSDGAELGRLPADRPPDLHWTVLGTRLLRLVQNEGRPSLEVWDLGRGRLAWSARVYLAEQ